MHKIDLHNYEAYLLDFSEGNLSDEYQMELELFLIQHPELNIDLAELSLVMMESDDILYSNKNSLKKSESDLVSEIQFIGYIENQLSTNERLNLEKSCAANPTLVKELTLYKNTIVTANTSVVYPNKKELKRKPKVIWFNFSATQFAAAASVLFLIGLVVFWSKTETINSQLAETLIKDTSTTKKLIVTKTITSQKTIPNIPETVKENNIAMTHSSTVTTIHLTLEKNTTIPPNENTSTVFKDSINNLAIDNSPPKNLKNETVAHQNLSTVIKENRQTVVQVITEDDGETTNLSADKKKAGIWATASRALKNLNHVGVKLVNGHEEDNIETTSYALTLGGVSIKHKIGNL
jgi:hypothetical protein